SRNVIVGRIRGGKVGTTTRARWRTSVASLDPTSGEPSHVWHLGALDAPVLLGAQALGSGGDVLASVVTGALERRPSFGRLLRLREPGRQIAWTRSLGRVPGNENVPLPAVAVDAGGDLVAAWVRHRRATGYDLRVVTLSGATGRSRRE